MLNELDQKLNQCADAYSTNKATNAAYKKIFYIIFKANIIDKQVNEYRFFRD